MSPPNSELLVRAVALYVPILIVLALLVQRRPDRRRVGGALVTFAWNLVGLLVLNVLARRVGWWSFSTGTGLVAGTPADLWIGWALLWGAAAILTGFRRLALVGAGLVGADLILMPMGAPVLDLGSLWLLGEALGVVTCLVPGLLLGGWTARGERAAWRAGLQAVAFSGLLLFVLPALVFTLTGEDWQALIERPRWHFVVAALVTAPVSAMALQAVREFAVVGSGTPVPLDPPLRLVVTGPYAYVANPMQIGGSVALATWGLLAKSSALVLAALMAAVFSAGLAAWNEGNDLTQRFGPAWLHYRSQVRSWLPRWRPYVAEAGTVFVGTTCEPCSEIGRFLARRRPLGLEIASAESASEDLTRITYQAAGVRDSGLAAVGRSLEHVNLGWAVASWILRLPLIRPMLQLIADAAGAGPRQLPTPLDRNHAEHR